MSKTIHDYTAASGIDASSDYLLIDPLSSGTYKKINRNTLLGITGNPVGTSDSQTLSSKTFDNSNAYTAKDGSLTLQNTSDTTKRAVFSLSGVTTGTTRTLTVPNASTTLVGTDNTATLTNKTLTSPTITGGTIDNSTITVDSISGHTSSTVVTVGGVQLNNGTIGTSGAVTSSSIAAGAVQPQALVSGTGTGWAWSSWTPTWTNLTVGNGTVEAKYIQVGKIVYATIGFALGSTSSISGSISYTLPVTANSRYSGSGTGKIRLGSFYAEDAGVTGYEMPSQATSTTTANILALSASGTYVSWIAASGSIPFSWAAGDFFAGTIMFEAA